MIEEDRNWKTASYACGPNGGNCVEVGLGTETVGVRDTKTFDETGEVLNFSTRQWNDFLMSAQIQR